jgi:hypothetical protein
VFRGLSPSDIGHRPTTPHIETAGMNSVQENQINVIHRRTGSKDINLLHLSRLTNDTGLVRSSLFTKDSYQWDSHDLVPPLFGSRFFSVMDKKR